MKKMIAIAVCVLAGLTAAGASAQDRGAKADIPFGFYAGNTWMPAGTYVLTSQAGSDIVTIRNKQRGTSVVALAGPSDLAASRSELVFAKYGNEYFLHDVLCGWRGSHLELLRTKRERNAQALEATVAQPSTVYLALLRDRD